MRGRLDQASGKNRVVGDVLNNMSVGEVLQPTRIIVLLARSKDTKVSACK